MNPMIIGGVVVALIIVGAVVIFALKGKSSLPATTTSQMPANSQNVDDTQVMQQGSAQEESTEATSEAMMESSVKEFTLEAGSYYFKPNTITVKKGDKVKVTINAVDKMHDFVIDEFNARTDIAKAGTSASVEFTADKVGSFEFYCNIANHRALGMVGTLTVEE